MNPEIFMDDFERSEFSDSYFGVLGRALVFSCRFERGVRDLEKILRIKENPKLLNEIEQFEVLFNKLEKLPLGNHLSKLKMGGPEIYEIFKVAVAARNEIAHEVSIGLDKNLDLVSKELLAEMVETVKNNVLLIAKADLVISYLISDITHEPIPNESFLNSYPDKVADWVCG